MFTWICPKCGGEVPPAYDECPRCNPRHAAAPVAAPAVAEPVAAPPAAPPPVAAAPPPPPPPPVAAAPPPPPPTPSAPPPVTAGPPPPPPAQPSYAPPDAYSHRTVPYGAQATTSARTVSPLLAALGAAAGTVALLALLYVFVLPHRGGSDKTSSAVTAETAEPVKLEKPGAEGASARTHPLAKHIEVSGVRIQEHSGGNVRIDFVVVNHSAADLPRMKMEVRLASGGREYFVIPVDLPSVGPYESKDMSTTVKTNLKPYELPDWQLVQAKFSIRD